MVRLRNQNDIRMLNDVELMREILAFYLFCTSEFLEFEDEDDLQHHDFGFAVAGVDDVDELQTNGEPEEVVSVCLQSGSAVRRIYRLVYPTAVFFVDEATASHLDFIVSAS